MDLGDQSALIIWSATQFTAQTLWQWLQQRWYHQSNNISPTSDYLSNLKNNLGQTPLVNEQPADSQLYHWQQDLTQQGTQVNFYHEPNSDQHAVVIKATNREQLHAQLQSSLPTLAPPLAPTPSLNPSITKHTLKIHTPAVLPKLTVPLLTR